ncbi:hypothetical protein ES703_118101 [subsurface metagenome]
MIGLEFLQKIGEILQKSLSSEETYSAVFDILDGVIEFDSATLFVVQPATGALEMPQRLGGITAGAGYFSDDEWCSRHTRLPFPDLRPLVVG